MAIAIDILGGCNRLKQREPCKQGSLYEMGVTLMKEAEVRDANEDNPQPNLPQLIDAETNLPLQQSVVERAAREAFMCPFCDAPCSIILDAARHDRLSPGEVDKEDNDAPVDQGREDEFMQEPSWAEENEGDIQDSDPLLLEEESQEEEDADLLLGEESSDPDDDFLL